MINTNMHKFLSQDNLKIYFYLFLTTVFLYIPILKNSSILLNRNNDLEEQFWPAFYLINKSIWQNHTLPLWNNLWFSGMPLLPDPQFSLFYPGNFLFYIFPTDLAFTLYFLVHSFVGGLGAFLVSKYGFNLSQKTSTFAGILYIFMPRISGYLEAGHFGLVGTTLWLPFLLLGVIKLAHEPKIRWILLISISSAGLFFTHTITFLITTLSAVLFFLSMLILYPLKKAFLKMFLFLSAGIFTFGLTAVTLLPQLEWLPKTSRYLLLQERTVYPIWQSFLEFLRNIFIPWSQGIEKLWSIDTEKWLALGIVPSILAVVGLVSLKKNAKLLIILISILISSVALNNISPLKQILLSQDWFVLSRVATRIWIIPTVMVVFLAAFGIDKISNSKLKKWTNFLMVICIFESLILFWLRLEKPISPTADFVPEEIYQFLASDSDHFRVFCLTRCLSQKKAAIYNLELVEGYNTLQQRNYFEQFIQLSQVYWNKYTLSLPPFEVYKFRELQPFSPELADYNVKYIISPYNLLDKNLELAKKIGNYLIYKNSIVKSRAFFADGSSAHVTTYTPNFIRVMTFSPYSLEFTLSEVWNQDWKAYLNGRKLVPISEPKNKVRNVKIKNDTEFVDFKYQPDSFIKGILITLTTLVTFSFLSLTKWQKIKKYY